MSKRPTLLAHISPRLANGEENLATESLAFVLHHSSAARQAFIVFLSRILGRPLPSLTFHTQAVDPDGTIPDLVGKDSHGRSIVFVEAKFWAGLTDAQPCGYLERLEREGGTGLIVVAPANRLRTLWRELCRRLDVKGDAADADQWFLADRATLPSMALMSWNFLLTQLLSATADASDSAASDDLRQLKGLCDSTEESGFLPLRSEELTGNVARRIQQYCQLVDDLVAELVNRGLAADASIGKGSGGSGYYGKGLGLVGGYGCWIRWYAKFWAKLGDTPIWLDVLGPTYKPSPEAREALSGYLSAQPPKAFADVDPRGGILVPLMLPIGVERGAVLAELVKQVAEIAALLPPLPGGTARPPTDTDIVLEQE